MKQLLALALIAGIPVASTLLSVVNPALAAPAQTLTPGAHAEFPTHAFLKKTKLCAKTLDSGTGRLDIRASTSTESMRVGPQETCIERQWGGVKVFATHGGGGSERITVRTF